MMINLAYIESLFLHWQHLPRPLLKPKAGVKLDPLVGALCFDKLDALLYVLKLTL